MLRITILMVMPRDMVRPTFIAQLVDLYGGGKDLPQPEISDTHSGIYSVLLCARTRSYPPTCPTNNINDARLKIAREEDFSTEG
jgi:hypothetical protein